MDTFARKCVKICDCDAGQSLSLSSLHLCDLALMKHYSAHYLHIVWTFAQHPAGSFTAKSKSLGQDIIQSLPRFKPFSETLSHFLELIILEPHGPGLFLINLM